MKRLLTVIFVLFIALQFTCGHVSSDGIITEKQPSGNPRVSVAVSQLNKAHLEFWQASYRIDSLLNQSVPQRRIIPMRASDPVHY